jgi:hypothetical protein
MEIGNTATERVVRASRGERRNCEANKAIEPILVSINLLSHNTKRIRFAVGIKGTIDTRGLANARSVVVPETIIISIGKVHSINQVRARRRGLIADCTK